MLIWFKKKNLLDSLEGSGFKMFSPLYTEVWSRVIFYDKNFNFYRKYTWRMPTNTPHGSSIHVKWKLKVRAENLWSMRTKIFMAKVSSDGSMWWINKSANSYCKSAICLPNTVLATFMYIMWSLHQPSEADHHHSDWEDWVEKNWDNLT